MFLKDLDYSYPDHLIAVEPKADFRTLHCGPGKIEEWSKDRLLAAMRPGDLLVVNDTQVVPRRVFTAGGMEVLFVKALSEDRRLWEVLFPARKVKAGEVIDLPGGFEMKLLEKGLPQQVELSKPMTEAYFLEYAELALPPYIQKARGQRNMRVEDRDWYKNAWGEIHGSSAAPTASLHFDEADLEALRASGVKVQTVTLHIGLGTFLPIRTDDLSDHVMHQEWAHLPADVAEDIDQVKDRGGRVWALGTTVTRTLESWKSGLLKQQEDGAFSGWTDLFIRPGFEFQAVDMLMTNFHQPKSTLLALVCAFAGRERVLEAYNYAIENDFRLFSYGDLSVWQKI